MEYTEVTINGRKLLMRVKCGLEQFGPYSESGEVSDSDWRWSPEGVTREVTQ